LQPFSTTRIRGKLVVSYSRYNDHLLLRAVARHLQRRLHVSLPNRERLVRGVIESLMDSTPMSILRRDISAFYESIPVAALRDKLLYDTASSTRVRNVFKKYFDQHCSGQENGIPRGVSVALFLRFQDRLRDWRGATTLESFVGRHVWFRTRCLRSGSWWRTIKWVFIPLVAGS
jgi:hypothetical protein